MEKPNSEKEKNKKWGKSRGEPWRRGMGENWYSVCVHFMLESGQCGHRFGLLDQ